jgi:hypothetical protein
METAVSRLKNGSFLFAVDFIKGIRDQGSGWKKIIETIRSLIPDF